MLKKEAAEVQKKVDDTDVVMAEVDSVSLEYLPVSTSCSSMYFTLESLNQVCMKLVTNDTALLGLPCDIAIHFLP